MTPFEAFARTRVVFGAGTLARLGEIARELGFRHVLLVADRGLVRAGHVDAAIGRLRDAGIAASPFHDFGENPDSAMVEAGRAFAAPLGVDAIVGLGGGSSLDCAKGINFLLTNGGTMAQYRGYGKAPKPFLPMIGVPTTAGTGSEAQSYAVISDAETHAKMACGAPGAAFRVAILDPELAATAPAGVVSAAGIDAIAHAVETWVSTKRTPISEMLSREAWRLLSSNYLRVVAGGDAQAGAAMLWGAFLAGSAIEHSMLGAAHAGANPLTRRYRTAHGVALAILLPEVVRWNSRNVGDRYAELSALAGDGRRPEGLAARLEDFVAAGAFPTRLAEVGVPEADLPALAEEAASQWTGGFNPRPFDAAGALEVYAAAY